MIRPVLKAHIIAITMLLLSVGALSQPIMGTRQLNLYTSDGLQSLSLQVAEPFTTVTRYVYRRHQPRVTL